MNSSALDGGNAAATEIARKKLGEEAPAREKQPASPAAQEDTVNISEEGKEKAATLTMRSQDEGGDDVLACERHPRRFQTPQHVR